MSRIFTKRCSQFCWYPSKMPSLISSLEMTFSSELTPPARKWCLSYLEIKYLLTHPRVVPGFTTFVVSLALHLFRFHRFPKCCGSCMVKTKRPWSRNLATKKNANIWTDCRPSMSKRTMCSCCSMWCTSLIWAVILMETALHRDTNRTKKNIDSTPGWVGYNSSEYKTLGPFKLFQRDLRHLVLVKLFWCEF